MGKANPPGKKYDAGLNSLIDLEPEAWAKYLAEKLHIPYGSMTELDTDLATTVQADKLFLISHLDGQHQTIIHLELEANHSLQIPFDLLRYNILIDGRFDRRFPVKSVLVILRPDANATDQSGLAQRADHDAFEYLTFRYVVIRIWEQSFDELMQGGLSIVPLAMLTNEALNNAQVAYERFEQKLNEPGITREQQSEIVSITKILCGMRRNSSALLELLKMKASIFEESTVYQEILQKGEARGEVRGEARGEVEGKLQATRLLILRLGTRRWGTPKAEITDQLNTIQDAERLMRIAEYVLDATSWDDLFQVP